MEEKLFDYIEKKLNLDLSLDDIEIMKELELNEEDNQELLNTIVTMKKIKSKMKKINSTKGLNKKIIFAPKEIVTIFTKELLAAQTPEKTEMLSSDLVEIEIDENSIYQIEIFNGGDEWILSLKDIGSGDLVKENKKIKLTYSINGSDYSYIINFVEGYGEIKKTKFKENYQLQDNVKIILLLEEADENV